MFSELYQYRELLKTSIKKEIRGKYKASALGVAWSFINPLLQVLVYAIVFPYILGNRVDNYIVYLVSGIIPWTFFQTTLNQSVSCIRNNYGIIKKVYFPRVILPISVVCSGLVNFMISCIIILLFSVLWGVGISWHIIFVPLIALVEAMFALGIGMALGAADAYFQDLEYFVMFLLQLFFYGSPIVYSIDQFSSAHLVVQLIRINPMTILINAYRDCFLYHQIPDFGALGLTALFSFVVLVIGYWIFRKLERGFAEQL